VSTALCNTTLDDGINGSYTADLTELGYGSAVVIASPDVHCKITATSCVVGALLANGYRSG